MLQAVACHCDPDIPNVPFAITFRLGREHHDRDIRYGDHLKNIPYVRNEDPWPETDNILYSRCRPLIRCLNANVDPTTGKRMRVFEYDQAHKYTTKKGRTMGLLLGTMWKV